MIRIIQNKFFLRLTEKKKKQMQTKYYSVFDRYCLFSQTWGIYSFVYSNLSNFVEHKSSFNCRLTIKICSL